MAGPDGHNTKPLSFTGAFCALEWVWYPLMFELLRESGLDKGKRAR